MNKTRISWPFILLTALSMSVGWGVRGQFGHEYGAALAGALGAMAVALLSGREDWRRRIIFFGVFGAIGWSFGGSMSYGKVIAYAHSPDSATVLYGYANIFVLGFLWAAPGGAGTALPAFLSRDKLTEFFLPMSAVFGGWLVQDMAVDLFRPSFSGMWFSQGLGVTVAILAVLVMACVRRKLETGSSLVLHLCVGWWIGFLVLVRLCGLHMSPPREDGWAGCLGLVAGLLLFCRRYRLPGVAFATLATGFLGGIGFALGQALKTACIATGLQTNWHSVMEQTQGFLHGVALAIAMGLLLHRAPKVSDLPPLRRWTEAYGVVFILWLLTYLNFRRSPGNWLQYIKSMPERMYGIYGAAHFLPSRGFVGWFELAFLAMGAALVWLLVLHLKHGLPLVPNSWLGKGQLLYLAFLWTSTFINFADVLPRFAPQRLVTEWVITINSAICTVLAVAFAATPPRDLPGWPEGSYAAWIRKTIATGLAGAVLISFAGWGLKHVLFGNSAVGYSFPHIRFGPNNTNDRR
jgi:hypothetical protein